MKIESSKSGTQVANGATTVEIGLPKKEFAAVLAGTSESNESLFDNRKSEKNDETKRLASDGFIDKPTSKEKKEARTGDGQSEKEPDSDRDKGIGNPNYIVQKEPEEFKFPGTRAILHVADLERIISSIRSQTVANGKQVTIELKRSVLQGLQLKLTIGIDKKVTAEFIAANENVKSQLNARVDELVRLLRDRGVKLRELKMSLGSESNDKNDRGRREDISKVSSKTSSLGEISTLSEPKTEDIRDGSDTSYQI